MTAHKDYPEDAVLKYIRTYITSNGFPPTMREIAAACDLSSKATAMRVVNRLQAQGIVERLPGQGRTIRISAANTKARSTPV